MPARTHTLSVGAENTPAAPLLSGWAQTAMLTRSAGSGKLYTACGEEYGYIINLFPRLNNSEFLPALCFSGYPS